MTLVSIGRRGAGAGAAARWRLVLFAFGDFAFNLYWQSVMLFLLFYYTDIVGIGVGWAATTFTIALVWDGLVSFAVGMAVDRWRAPGGYRRYLMLGAVPLGVSFVLLYLPVPASGALAGAMILGTHLLFRTGYAMVNIPYLAMSARVSSDAGDRALVAGMRMLFGTLALVVVTLGTQPLGAWLAGGKGPIAAHLAAAAALAGVGTAILLLVGAFAPEHRPAPVQAPPALGRVLAALAHNRAFVLLNAAMAGVVIASTFLSKSVLYYYKTAFGDVAAGQLAFALMGAVGLVAVPLWTLACRALGGMTAWFAATGLALVLLGAFAGNAFAGTHSTQFFLAAMQVALIGLNIVFWALLPNTVEYGERVTGLRLEGAVMGLAALLQRVAIGVATALFGLTLETIGYRADMVAGAATRDALRLAVALVPLAFLAVAAVLIALSPLGRRAHAAVLAALARE
ncbi:MFS transporter [Sphingomonas sp. CJ20]